MKYIYTILVVFITFSACSKKDIALNETINNPSKKMQEFISDISLHAKNKKPNFFIIPQNAIELAYNNLSIKEGINLEYMNTIDAVGIEALFYDGDEIPFYERHEMLQEFSKNKKVLVSDYLSNNNLLNDVIQKNTNESFLCFPRLQENYDYTIIPEFTVNENTNDIVDLEAAKNYLYLINSENYSSKEDFINSIVNTNFDIILIDLFFHSKPLSKTDILKLKIKKNGGKRLVISYVNIGAAEKYRYYFNKDQWEINNPHWLMKPYKGYPDEIFVKYWAKEWHEIIYQKNDSYINKIIEAGFDGAYLDNVKSYEYLFSDKF